MYSRSVVSIMHDKKCALSLRVCIWSFENSKSKFDHPSVFRGRKGSQQPPDQGSAPGPRWEQSLRPHYRLMVLCLPRSCLLVYEILATALFPFPLLIKWDAALTQRGKFDESHTEQLELIASLCWYPHRKSASVSVTPAPLFHINSDNCVMYTQQNV